MLVLVRKPGDTVVIDGNITIRVIRTGTGKVRLGFDAPNEIEIVRGELLIDTEEYEEDDVTEVPETAV
jgi:carbon storage regulator